MDEEQLHKNMEGIYTVQFFDKYGRPLKELEKTALNYLVSLEVGNKNITEEAVSFIVRRTLYNSIDHKDTKE